MMKSKLRLLPLLLLGVTAQAQNHAQVYIDMGARGNDVSKSMYGMFFEEINHAGDGGLYAEMLQNRGFEEHVLPSGMTYKNGRAVAPHSLNYWGLDYVDSYVDWNIAEKKTLGWRFSASGLKNTKTVEEMSDPLNANTPNALHLVMTEKTQDDGVLNVINDGYWGVATKMGATYKLRFYLRTSDYKGTLKAMLATKKNQNVGDADFNVVNDGKWHEYTATLTAAQDMSDGNFRLQFSGIGTVDVDYVSLFPTDTYKGRANGLRRDIAETLEGLKPSFLRWPGGCIVEGITLENRVKWKETLGDPMTRRGEFSLWGYRSTYGLGMYEFLQLCEDMGMDGMFVGNVGMSCSIRNGDFVSPDDEAALLPFRQDIEDAIEYAIGDPATNEWAKKRAEAGHPAPFPLKYVELGNENGSERYIKRFKFFYDYLKTKYPQITFINTMTWADAQNFEKTDMYDVHWYVTPDEFYNSATLFDTAPRGDYKIYAGEYAVNNEVGHGNMDAALGEACFIGAMERNSDFVTMASYAPLLTNVNQQNWHCNLIWYDTDRVMGRASYYVQKLFSHNRPDYNVKTRLYSDGQTLMSEGKVGVGTWATQAKFRNLQVKSLDGKQDFYKSDFVGKQNEWLEQSGTWSVDKDGNYAQSSSGSPCISVMSSSAFRNSTLEVEAKKISGSEGFLIIFGCDTLNANNHYRLNLGGWGNSKAAIERVTNGNGTVVGDKVDFKVENNRWYKIKIDMREGDGIYAYVDGKLLLKYTTGDLLNGRLQAFGGYDESTHEVVVKVVNAKEEPLTTTLHLNGNQIQADGKVITLKAESLQDENSLDEPTKIAPLETDYHGFASQFEYTFPKNSLTIFRIKADASAPAAMKFPVYSYDDTPIPLSEVKVKYGQATDKLQELIDEAKQYAVEGVSGVETLKESIATAQSVLDNPQSLIKQLEQAATILQKGISSYFAGLMQPANEKTSGLQNPDFASGKNTGWKGSLPTVGNEVGEFFNCTFDMYQTLNQLENGYYLVSVQGFYRNGTIEQSYAAHNKGTEQLNTLFYANDVTKPLCSLYDYATGGWNNSNYADNMAQAHEGFSASSENYANYLIVKVTDGTLKVGIKKDANVSFDWSCFNNFRVFYVSDPQATTIQTVALENKGSHYYTLDGVAHRMPVVGVNIHNGKKILVK